MLQVIISIPQTMDAELRSAKKSLYREQTRNDMICDLILRGLAVQQAEHSTSEVPLYGNQMCINPH